MRLVHSKNFRLIDIGIQVYCYTVDYNVPEPHLSKLTNYLFWLRTTFLTSILQRPNKVSVTHSLTYNLLRSRGLLNWPSKFGRKPNASEFKLLWRSSIKYFSYIFAENFYLMRLYCRFSQGWETLEMNAAVSAVLILRSTILISYLI